MADIKQQNKPVYQNKQQPEPRNKKYKLNEIYEKGGRKRQVVGIVGVAESAIIPVLIIQDVTGREYDVAPQLTMSVVHNLEMIVNEAERKQKEQDESGASSLSTWADVDRILNVVSEACIADAPKFTPEFLKSNFATDIVMMFAQQIIEAAMQQAAALKATYEADPATKNDESATEN